MIAQLAMLLAAQASQPLSAMYDRVTPQAAAERVMRCAVGPVTVKSEAGLETEVLVVAANGPLTDEQIDCIDRAASFYNVELPASAQSGFNKARETRATAYLAGEGRKWLLVWRISCWIGCLRIGRE